MNQNRDAVDKLIKALEPEGYAFMSGYLSSLLARIIDEYVPEDEQQKLRIDLMSAAITILLDNKR